MRVVMLKNISFLIIPVALTIGTLFSMEKAHIVQVGSITYYTMKNSKSYVIKSSNYDIEEARYSYPFRKKDSSCKEFFIKEYNSFKINPCCYFFTLFMAGSISGGISAIITSLILQYIQS